MERLIEILNEGGVAIIPTDTIYGMVTPALNQKSVERLYKIKKRPPEKPFIILISKIDQIEDFGIELNEAQKNLLENIWPEKVSVILEGVPRNFDYLSRGTGTLAFRLPKNDYLIKLIDQVGPLVAPSVNLSGELTAKTVEEAKNIFNKQVDFYVDAGKLNSPPSTLIEFVDNKIKVLRQGEVHLNDLKFKT